MGDIDNLVVLNGTEGVQEAVLGSIAKGFAAIQALRGNLTGTSNGGAHAPSSNGTTPADGAADVPESIRRTSPPIATE